MDTQDTARIIELVIPYQEGKAKALEDSEGLFVKSLGIEYTRTFNTDNYESAKFTVVLWADRDGRNELEKDLAALWQIARENLREQALPVLRERDKKRQPAAKKAKKPTAPASPATTTPPPSPPAGGPPLPRPEAAAPGTPVPQGAGVKSGTAELVKLMVQPDGKVEFYCKGFRWPFKDSRGAETVISLFHPNLGWTSEHLYPGALYEGAVLTGVKVDWQKSDKGYYDVLRVYS